MPSVRALRAGLAAVAFGLPFACAAPASFAASTLPPAISTRLAASGLPLSSFGLLVQRVDAPGAPLVSLNAERAFQLASTTKLVTSLAALDLLRGPGAPPAAALRAAPPLQAPVVATWPVHEPVAAPLRTAAPTAAPVAALSEALDAASDAEGDGDGNDAEDDDGDDAAAVIPAPPAAPAAPAARATRTAAGAAFLRDGIVVRVAPAAGNRAAVSLQPHPKGVTVVNEVAMDGACGAWAQWRPGRPATLQVRGRWNQACGTQEIARLRAPAAPLARLREAAAAALTAPARAVSALGRDLPALLREMNKTSDNGLARSLLLRLAPENAPAGLRAAQARVHRWLRAQGLAEGDIRVEVGSGQSRLERGKPRAMVALLRRAWRADASGPFVASLPIAGVDGTLARRLRDGPAAGRAWLKTGTLHDTRALAGYVRGRSGRVYAVTVIVNHRHAARATPTLDAVVEWVAAHG